MFNQDYGYAIAGLVLKDEVTTGLINELKLGLYNKGLSVRKKYLWLLKLIIDGHDHTLDMTGRVKTLSKSQEEILDKVIKNKEIFTKL